MAKKAVLQICRSTLVSGQVCNIIFCLLFRRLYIGGQLLATSWCMASGNHWQYADNRTVGGEKYTIKKKFEWLYNQIRHRQITSRLLKPHIYLQFSTQKGVRLCSQLPLTPALPAKPPSWAAAWSGKDTTIRGKSFLETSQFVDWQERRYASKRIEWCVWESTNLLCPCFQHDGGIGEKVANVFL